MSAGGHWRRSQAVPNVRRRTLGTAWESTYGSGGSPGSFRETKPRFALTRPDPSSGGVGGLCQPFRPEFVEYIIPDQSKAL